MKETPFYKSEERSVDLRFFKGVALALVGAALIFFISASNNVLSPSPFAGAASSSTNKNIVVIMDDDLDEQTFDIALAQNFMPNLRQYVLDQGVRFSNALVTTSLCCPSRSTFLTGQYSHNHGVLDNKGSTGGVTRLNDSSTIATWLQTAGYRTGHVGKYLNGYGENTNSSSPKDDPTYVPPGWNDWQALVGASTYKMYSYTINDNKTLVKYGTGSANYQTDVLATRAKNFIDETETNDTQPFFLVVTPVAPHVESNASISGCSSSKRWDKTVRPAPRHKGTLPSSVVVPKPPSFNETDFTDKPAWMRNNLPPMTTLDIDCVNKQFRDRVESLRAVDDLIGTVVNALSANGELENTAIIFMSDNGWLDGEHRWGSKFVAYEESLHVPLIIRDPAIAGPQTISAMVLFNDLAPTLAEWGSATPTITMDGRSLVPLMQNPQVPWRKRALAEYLGSAYPPIESYSAVRTSASDTPPNRLYVMWTKGDRELYNLDNDPYQLSSVHNDPAYSSERTTLENWINQLKTCAGDTCRTLED